MHKFEFILSAYDNAQVYIRAIGYDIADFMPYRYGSKDFVRLMYSRSLVKTFAGRGVLEDIAKAYAADPRRVSFCELTELAISFITQDVPAFSMWRASAFNCVTTFQTVLNFIKARGEAIGAPAWFGYADFTRFLYEAPSNVPVSDMTVAQAIYGDAEAVSKVDAAIKSYCHM